MLIRNEKAYDNKLERQKHLKIKSKITIAFSIQFFAKLMERVRFKRHKEEPGTKELKKS